MSITNEQDDFPIYRIMSIYEFYELYVKNRLKLALFSLQKDENDGIEDFLNHLISFGNFEKKDEAKDHLSQIRNNKYMTCWSREKESIAMWSLYSPAHESIMVSTTRNKLSNALEEFDRKHNFTTIWKRPNEKLATFIGHIKEARYVNIREFISRINEKYKNIQDVSNEEELHSGLSLLREISKDIGGIDSFIKDISYQHENEIRGEVNAGVSIAGKYSSEKEWEKSDNTLGIPVDNNKGEDLKQVEYAEVNQDFIEEIIFDPRMDSYKKECLIEMMKIDKEKITESKCFSPVIDSDFKFYRLKGLI
nr:DUF2971 domain-containing protein [uncultured Aggregatibacter sp.]